MATTKLLRPITRELASTDQRGNTLVMTLEPGDVLTFRIKGTRQRASVYIGHCFALATIMEMEARYKQRLDAYNAKKKAGAKGLKPPKKPFNPFSKMYHKALA